MMKYIFNLIKWLKPEIEEVPLGYEAGEVHDESWR